MPKCIAEIHRQEESQEQYWARKVDWTVRHIENSGVTLRWRKVRDCRNFEACLPYISDYADSELVEEILYLL